MIVFVHMPHGTTSRPDVLWWQGDDGGLKEIVTGEDTPEVKVARYQLHQKAPDVSWNDAFQYLGEFDRNSQNWDTHEISTTPQEYAKFLMDQADRLTQPTKEAFHG